MSFVMAFHLHRLNKKQERRRIATGRTAKLVDTSILTLKEAAKAHQTLSGQKAEIKDTPDVKAEDLTDMQNMDFHYVSFTRGHTA